MSKFNALGGAAGLYSVVTASGSKYVIDLAAKLILRTPDGSPRDVAFAGPRHYDDINGVVGGPLLATKFDGFGTESIATTNIVSIDKVADA